jgi:hypothetical protein
MVLVLKKMFQTFYLNGRNLDKMEESGSAVSIVSKVWNEATGNQEVANKSQLVKICQVIQPDKLTEEVSNLICANL